MALTGVDVRDGDFRGGQVSWGQMPCHGGDRWELGFGLTTAELNRRGS